MDDMELVRDYVSHGSEPAFETLVQRHVHLVYSAAIRQVRNPQLAEEITQATFVLLARKARALPPGIILPGWLIKTVRFVAATEMRSAARRQRREREAQMDSLTYQEQTPDPRWQELAPLLDEALAVLGDRERDAVVLRFLQQKPLQDVGVALGINPATAQKRVWRAVDKLRGFFAKRGVVVPAVAVTAFLTANAVHAAPAGVATAATVAALKGATATSTAALINATLKVMAWAKLKTAVTVTAGILLTAGTAAVVVEESHYAGPRVHGYSASHWVNEYKQAWLTTTFPTPAGVGTNAMNALVALGPSAIPYIAREMERADETRRKARDAGVNPAPMPAGPNSVNPAIREQYAFNTALCASGKAGIPQLVDLLNNSHDNVRMGAGFALHTLAEEEIYTQDEIEALTRSLTDENPRIRAVAADCMGHIGPAAMSAVPALILALEDEADDGNDPAHPSPLTAARYQYLAALTGIGPAAREAVPTVKNVLAGASGDTALEANAALALWKIERQPTNSLPMLMDIFLHRTGDRSPAVIQALGEMGPAASNAVPRLTQMLTARVQAPSPEAAAAAASQSVSLPTPHRVRHAGPPPLPPFEQLRLQAAIALWRIDSRLSGTVPLIVGDFLNFDCSHDHNVLRALGEIGPPAKAALPRLLFELANHANVLDRFPEMATTVERIDPGATSKVEAYKLNARK